MISLILNIMVYKDNKAYRPYSLLQAVLHYCQYEMILTVLNSESLRQFSHRHINMINLSIYLALL